MGRQFDVAVCLDCKTHRRVYHREWIRASRPRCLKCGGPVEISNMAREEHLAHQEAKAYANAKVRRDP